MVLRLSDQLILLIAAIIIFSYLLKYHFEERRREQALLDDIKVKLLPVLTRNLNTVSSMLGDVEKLLEGRVKLEDLFNRDLSKALFVDFKQHFYDVGVRLSDFRDELAKFDEAVLGGEVGLEELRSRAEKLRVEAKELLELLGKLKDVEKLPPRKFSLKSF